MKKQALIKKAMGIIGSIKTPKKSRSSARNGLRGGRPTQKLIIDPKGNWAMYYPQIPAGYTPLGTVQREKDHSTGALVRVESTGRYLQINAGVARSLDTKSVEQQLQNN